MVAKPLSAAVLQRIKILLFAACLLPLARLIALGLLHKLGANPIEFITRSAGTWNLVFLLTTLSVTPLRRLTGQQWLMRLRRMLELYAFFYACLHFTTYIWLDQFFDGQAIVKDVLKRPFITIGFTNFLLLIPLAATSIHSDRSSVRYAHGHPWFRAHSARYELCRCVYNAMMKKLGGARWQQLHRFVYLIAVGGVVRYWWLVKKT